MQFKNTIEAVYVHLDEIQQLVAKIGFDGEIHAIDVDLVMDKTRRVYDLMLLLKQEAASFKSKEIVEPEKEKIIVPETFVVSDTQSINVHESKADMATEANANAETEAKAETIAKHEDIITVHDKKQQNIVLETEKREPTSGSKKTLGETFTKSKPSLNEELSQHAPKSDINAHLKKKPIASLTSAIGVAEKFELIQNLFGGNKVKYDDTIKVLNSFTVFSEAIKYIEDNFDWDKNSAYAQKIIELLGRKLNIQ